MKHHNHFNRATATAHLPVQLTKTDIAIAELLDEHSAMTTDQLTAILFDNRKQCRDRLRWLWKLQFVIPRPQIDWGAGPSEPENWMLTHESAQFLARQRGQRSPTAAMVLKRQIKITEAVWRGEILEGNNLFAHLINASRKDPDCQLVSWQSSAAVAKRHGITVTGGHGVWREGNHEVGFFVHRAHKPIGRNWVSELSAYAQVREANGPAYPALLILPSTSQETQVHTALANDNRLAGIVATAVGGSDPLGHAWKLVGQSSRVRLIDLPSDHGVPNPNGPGLPSEHQDFD